MSQKIKISLIIFISTLCLFSGPEVSAQASKPQIIAQAKTNIRELPRTGLSPFALGLAAILPAGLILRKLFKKTKQKEFGNLIWHERQLK